MRDIIKMNEQLQARMIEEAEAMLTERTMLRDVALGRGRALQARWDEELHRIDKWAQSQKDVVKEVFSAMITENNFDVEKHSNAIHRLKGNSTPTPERPGAKPGLQQVHRPAAE
ncbi:MAG: hypothetical protein H7X89_00605 [Rhizobiales bacterium]|nr:hypothetical protein [Hyphomicrobiales bacterium]